MSALPPCPFATPGDDDLAGVVTRLTTITTRHGAVPRDPNETEVRWLLEAGVRALSEAVLDRSSEPTGPVAYSHANGLFDTLPVERVMRCFRDMCHEHGLDPGSANKARLIRRWSFAANYQLDLIAYLFRPAVLDHNISEAERLAQDLLPHITLEQFVDGFAIPESTYSPIDTLFRVQHVLRLMFPRDEAIRTYASSLYDIRRERWGRFFATLADAFGLTFTGLSPADTSTLITLVAEGGLFRDSSLPRSANTSDGTPAVVLASRLILVAAFEAPWSELAGCRAVDRPTAEPVAPSLPAPPLVDAVPVPVTVTLAGAAPMADAAPVAAPAALAGGEPLGAAP